MQLSHTRYVRWVVLSLAVLMALVAARPTPAATLLKANDRVVIYGDSITEQRLYSRYIQQYIYCRYPELHVKFFNAGWSGDQAGGALGRLQRDVLVLNPTVVTLFFGMNDGGYRAVNDDTLKNYRANMEGIIKALQDKGVRVVVFTPGAVDYDKRPALRDVDYNKTLAALGNVGKELAQQYHCAFMDVHQPMLDFMTAQKAKTPDFVMIPDAVHPNPQGHLVMAHLMLQGLGAEAMPAIGTINVATGQGVGLHIVSKSAAQITLENMAPLNVPFWFDPASANVMRDSNFLAMAGQKLTVRGLAPGTYRVAIDGAGVGAFSNAELAGGALLPGSYSALGQRIHDLTDRKENSYFNAWREVRLPLADVTGSQQIVAGLMAADEGYHSVIHNLSTPLTKITITLTVAPGGPNLALHKKYEASDPNVYNYGIGGLTDGSWDSNLPHTFATGEAATFPKNVTIDLEQPARIGLVLVGVPAFGSTKTVNVSVSADGKQFTEVGTHQFSLRQEEQYTYAFPAVTARYVRLTYADHYDEQVGYVTNFGFTTEVEVYAPGTGSLNGMHYGVLVQTATGLFVQTPIGPIRLDVGRGHGTSTHSSTGPSF